MTVRGTIEFASDNQKFLDKFLEKCKTLKKWCKIKKSLVCGASVIKDAA